jgi:carboxymethylenebutenolidase
VPRALALVAGAALGPGATWGRDELASVLRWVEGQPWGEGARVGVAGFCYGGGAALRCAEEHHESIAAVACFYGAPLEDAGRLQCPVLAIYGSRDAQFPPATVDAFEKHLQSSAVEATVLRFEGQPHAFVTDFAAVGAGGAAGEAWAEFVKFLRMHALLPDRPPVIMDW